MTLAINGHASFSPKFFSLAPTWRGSWKSAWGRQDIANLAENSCGTHFLDTNFIGLRWRAERRWNVVHKSIKMWRAEQKICYAAVSPCFPFGCAKTFSIFQRAFYLKNQFAIVGRLSKQILPVCYRQAIQLRRKRFPASIDCLNLIVVENLDGNWQPQPGPGLARNQKIIKGCVTVCERQPWKAENSSCRASWCAVRGMLDTFVLQCRCL